MTNRALKPCPWCGCEAELHETTDGWIAACGSEQSVLDGLTHKAHAYGATEAEAAKAWNARATLGSGKLTAEQVQEAIERNFGKVAVLDDGGPVEWRDDWVCKVGINYRAIADELNAALRGTCRMEPVGHYGSFHDIWRCGEHDALTFCPEQTVRDLERLARDLYALLTAPEPYTPAEMAARIAAMDYAKVRMSELGLEVD
ncbi:Uncharacterised protein [Slackia heliotrinireducens]|uniref:Uncharacterized protein n=1 Tax=Slackia heliotrinireducens (strain ATCC 29202 / DSM 20476 / NCTC 11029 / RHS 1) TaxID=471855 RepID=C7N6Q7_SLAHD|nr:Lar family restriction alleviation protein [Slackia heliotrinireducens]ACV22592.1 hypothetical protein Shel_15730 [Slackia heliotrinireducens DSM 20476]VEH01095.1 Uncharacterised protein [Slackia heliotrinireducens]